MTKPKAPYEVFEELATSEWHTLTDLTINPEYARHGDAAVLRGGWVSATFDAPSCDVTVETGFVPGRDFERITELLKPLYGDAEQTDIGPYSVETAHNATAQYHHWSGGQDRIPDDEIDRLLDYHDADALGFDCVSCGQTVHVGGLGWNEQVVSYVRYGPHFICAACILDCVDLPEIPWEDGW